MSSPSTDSFCNSGHHVKSVPCGYLDFDDPNECPLCGSTKIATILDWGSNDCIDGMLVPFEPITKEWISVWNDEIRGEVNAPIYDISNIPQYRWHDRKALLAS